MSAVVAGLAAFGGYVVASYVLLRKPLLLHRRKPDRFRRCVHISHRGGAGENLENTMVAFQNSVKLTATEMLELDCHMTKV